MREKTLEEETRSWHLSKTVSLTFIAGIVFSIVLSAWNTTYLLRTLDTQPPLPEQVKRNSWDIQQNKDVLGRILILNEKQDENSANIYTLMRAFTKEINDVKVDVKVNGSDIDTLKKRVK